MHAYKFASPAAVAVADQLRSMDALVVRLQGDRDLNIEPTVYYQLPVPKYFPQDLDALDEAIGTVKKNDYEIRTKETMPVLEALLKMVARLSRDRDRDIADDVTKSSLLGVPLDTVYGTHTGAAIHLDDIPLQAEGDGADDMHELPSHATLQEVFSILNKRLAEMRRIEIEARTLISQMTVIAREWREAEERCADEPDPFVEAVSDVVTLRLTICDSEGLVHGRDHRASYELGYIREIMRPGAPNRGVFADDLKCCLGELIRRMVADISK